MTGSRIAIIGAGIGGLAAAIRLAAAGLDVTVFEKSPYPGGKMRVVPSPAGAIDSGPTVLTLREVFEALFAAAGADFARAVPVAPLAILARHAWPDGALLDLHADRLASADAIAAFAGPREAHAFAAFADEAAALYRLLAPTFLQAERPGVLGLARRIGLTRPGALLALKPFQPLWQALGRHFRDPRLRQLFARYATYTGASPFLAPATLMLIAHVEQEGVWTVEGGMQRLAGEMMRLAAARGARFRMGEPVAEIVLRKGRACGLRLGRGEAVPAEIVLSAVDPAALAAGLLGPAAVRGVPVQRRGARSLSALTWSLAARTEGFAPARHTVFFSPDYAAEFQAILGARRLPKVPTVYLCAQDRGGEEDGVPAGPERLFLLVNAPPDGDISPLHAEDITRCAEASLRHLAACGLTIAGGLARAQVTTPQTFNGLFPGSGGALYGTANHGWRAPFRRPGSRSAIPGLYLAGGGVHPGPGVPMAALSGMLAAEAILADRRSTRR